MFGHVIVLHYFFISGRILNRFSKDVGAVDEILSLAFVESFQILSTLIGIMVQVLIINWWLLLPMSIMVVLQMNIKTMYLATAQSVKRQEGNGNFNNFNFFSLFY